MRRIDAKRSRHSIKSIQTIKSIEQFEEAHALCVREAQLIWGLIQFLRKSTRGLNKLALLIWIVLQGGIAIFHNT